MLAHGSLIKTPADPAWFVDTSFLDTIAKRSPFLGAEDRHRADPHVEPNSSNLDRNAPQNQEYLQTIKRAVSDALLAKPRDRKDARGIGGPRLGRTYRCH